LPIDPFVIIHLRKRVNGHFFAFLII